ncbi:MAG: hypothetical protein GXP08_13980 [Gammaproteobacteria bacterium]|nr:hypothetical protein [Gammaproteobacteria bacterium]
MKIISAALLVICLGLSQVVVAGDDPSIKGQQRLDIKAAMGNHIDDSIISGKYLVFDAKNGALRKLELKKLHSGIVKKGDYFVSCADFVDAKGKLYDLDFLVVKKGTEYRVIQSLVHAVDGEKRPYHVEG